MKLTVYVKSCARDRDLGFHIAIRETWGAQLKALGVETYFVTADPMRLQMCDGDEVNFQNCPDDYLGLPEKTRRTCDWARTKRKDHIFLCDTDTVVSASKLLALPYLDYDYAGGFKGGAAEIGKRFEYTDAHMPVPSWLWPWASGGYGYFLSPKAQAIVSRTLPQVWAEDMYVGQVLGPFVDLNIAAFPMKKVTAHLPKDSNWSPEILRKYLESK